MNFANFEKWLLINILNLGWWYLSSIVTNSLMYWTMDLAQYIKHFLSKPSPRTVLSKNGATWRNDRSRCIKLSSEKVISKQNSVTNKSKTYLYISCFPRHSFNSLVQVALTHDSWTVFTYSGVILVDMISIISFLYETMMRLLWLQGENFMINYRAMILQFIILGFQGEVISY